MSNPEYIQSDRTCANETCRQVLIRRVNELPYRWRTRRHCSLDCWHKNRPKGRPYLKTRLEDVEFLLGIGESPEQIANRLNVSMSTLMRWLYRQRQQELARLFIRKVA